LYFLRCILTLSPCLWLGLTVGLFPNYTVKTLCAFLFIIICQDKLTSSYRIHWSTRNSYCTHTHIHIHKHIRICAAVKQNKQTSYNTKYTVTLRAILNAPWYINNHRFNEDLQMNTLLNEMPNT
jgi:hypothetical protein